MEQSHDVTRRSAVRHVLQLHHGDEERLAGLVLAARAGLHAGELVLLVSDRPAEDEAVLRQGLAAAPEQPSRGTVRAVAPSEVGTAAGLRAAVSNASGRGYRGLRLLQVPPFPSMSEADYRGHERVLDEVADELPVTAICSVHARALPPGGLETALAAHRHVVDPCLTVVTDPVVDGEVTLSLAGDVDVSNVEVLRMTVAAALAEPDGARKLVVDTAGLAVLSAAGFRALVEATESLRAAGGQVRLVGASPVVRRVADILATPPVPGLVVEGGTT